MLREIKRTPATSKLCPQRALNLFAAQADPPLVGTRETDLMDTSGREFALHFHGLDNGDPRVREQFRSICLNQLELTDQQALDILTARATRVLCSDIPAETLQDVARSLQQIGVRVDIADPEEEEEVFIPSGSFSTDHDSTFRESQLFERPIQVRAAREAAFEDYASGYVEEFFDHDKHFGLLSVEDSTVRPHGRARNRHALFLRRRRALSLAERAGLGFVACALVALFAVFVMQPELPLPGAATAAAPGAAEQPPVASGLSVLAAANPAANPSAETGARTFEGTAKRDGVSLSLKWNTVGTASSLRVNIEQATAQGAAPGPRLVRAEGDPTFLVEQADGTWHGDAPIYLSVENDGRQLRLAGHARFIISPAQDGRSAVASVTVTYPKDSADAPAGGTEELPGFSLSLNENVMLRASGGPQ